LKQKKLFNPNAIDQEVSIFGGETTNLLDLTEIVYPKFHELTDKAFSNNWLPHRQSMMNDKYDYENNLTQPEKDAFNKLVSFLTFLDSLQTNNLQNIMAYITSPDIVYFLARQTYDESLHSRSYAHILTSIMSVQEAKDLINLWNDYEPLKKRNEWIADIYQTFVDKPSERNFVRALLGNFMLEGVYFWSSFYFFHNLGSRGLMNGSQIQIKYIQRDEYVHLQAFIEIFRIIREEKSNLFNEMKSELTDLFQRAVEIDLEFSNDVIGDEIFGINTTTNTDFTFYNANTRMKEIGLEAIFPKSQNPYRHLDRMAAFDDETTQR